jgi:hypothetical protein
MRRQGRTHQLIHASLLSLESRPHTGLARPCPSSGALGRFSASAIVERYAIAMRDRDAPRVDEHLQLVPGELSRIVDKELFFRWRARTNGNDILGELLNRGCNAAARHVVVVLKLRITVTTKGRAEPYFVRSTRYSPLLGICLFGLSPYVTPSFATQSLLAHSVSLSHLTCASSTVLPLSDGPFFWMSAR